MGFRFEFAKVKSLDLLGPNGAGKTTTLKTLLRLIFPTQGEIKIFGSTIRRELMANVGYMPENPYVYQYLTPLEFLDLCGGLSGLRGAQRRRRVSEMIEKVGLVHAQKRQSEVFEGNDATRRSRTSPFARSRMYWFSMNP